MRNFRVFACPNIGVRLYLIVPGTEIWLCQECIDQAEQMVQQNAQNRKELAVTG